MNKKSFFEKAVIIEYSDSDFIKRISYVKNLKILNIKRFYSNVSKIINRKRTYIVFNEKKLTLDLKFKTYGLYLRHSPSDLLIANFIFHRINGPSCIVFNKMGWYLWYEYEGEHEGFIGYKYSTKNYSHITSKRNCLKAKMLVKYGNL